VLVLASTCRAPQLVPERQAGNTHRFVPALMPDPYAASHPELPHRHHVLHELIDGDLGALVEA